MTRSAATGSSSSHTPQKSDTFELTQRRKIEKTEGLERAQISALQQTEKNVCVGKSLFISEAYRTFCNTPDYKALSVEEQDGAKLLFTILQARFQKNQNPRPAIFAYVNTTTALAVLSKAAANFTFPINDYGSYCSALFNHITNISSEICNKEAQHRKTVVSFKHGQLTITRAAIAYRETLLPEHRDLPLVQKPIQSTQQFLLDELREKIEQQGENDTQIQQWLRSYVLDDPITHTRNIFFRNTSWVVRLIERFQKILKIHSEIQKDAPLREDYMIGLYENFANESVDLEKMKKNILADSGQSPPLENVYRFAQEWKTIIQKYITQLRVIRDAPSTVGTTVNSEDAEEAEENRQWVFFSQVIDDAKELFTRYFYRDKNCADANALQRARQCIISITRATEQTEQNMRGRLRCHLNPTNHIIEEFAHKGFFLDPSNSNNYFNQKMRAHTVIQPGQNHTVFNATSSQLVSFFRGNQQQQQQQRQRQQCYLDSKELPLSQGRSGNAMSDEISDLNSAAC